MKKERLLKVLLEPHLSEKASSGAMGYPQYIFKVARDANKLEIKAAVEQLFSVPVRKVNVSNLKGAKATKFGRVVGQKSSWKKAYVVLEAGSEIAVI